jgi:AbrB family looped-hinge helix DNA binding protein
MPRRGSRKPYEPPGFAEQGAELRGAPAGGGAWGEDRRRRLKIGPGGRVVIPADFRRAMEIKEGDVVTALLEDGELRLVGIKVAVRKAQAMVRKYVPEGVSLVDELIEDRRREAEEESRNG